MDNKNVEKSIVRRPLLALWQLALATVVVVGLVSLARNGQTILALTAVILPVSIAALIKVRRRAAPQGPDTGEGAAVVHQLAPHDRIRIAKLAASGNAIEAIRSLRTLVDVDLLTAKQAVEHLGRIESD